LIFGSDRTLKAEPPLAKMDVDLTGGPDRTASGWVATTAAALSLIEAGNDIASTAAIVSSKMAVLTEKRPSLGLGVLSAVETSLIGSKLSPTLTLESPITGSRLFSVRLAAFSFERVLASETWTESGLVITKESFAWES
jgi:hypothetical protein